MYVKWRYEEWPYETARHVVIENALFSEENVSVKIPTFCTQTHGIWCLVKIDVPIKTVNYRPKWRYFQSFAGQILSHVHVGLRIVSALFGEENERRKQEAGDDEQHEQEGEGGHTACHDSTEHAHALGVLAQLHDSTRQISTYVVFN